MYVIELQPITKDFTSGYEPPNSYDMTTYLQYQDATPYVEGNIVWDWYLRSYENASESDYIVWYVCNAPCTGKKPHENKLYWSELVPDNQTAYLDRYIDTKTVSALDKPLKIEISGDVFDVVAAFNITARYVILSYDVDATPYERIKDMLEDTSHLTNDSYVGDERYKNSVLFNFPSNATNITLTLSNSTSTTSSGYVAIGKVVKGRARTIGDTLLPISISLMSLSEKTKDKSGFSFYKKGYTYKDASYDVIVPNTYKDLVFRIMQSLDAKDVLFTPTLIDDDMSVVCLGTFKDFELLYADDTNSTYNLKVEGTV